MLIKYVDTSRYVSVTLLEYTKQVTTVKQIQRLTWNYTQICMWKYHKFKLWCYIVSAGIICLNLTCRLKEKQLERQRGSRVDDVGRGRTYSSISRQPERAHKWS